MFGYLAAERYATGGHQGDVDQSFIRAVVMYKIAEETNLRERGDDGMITFLLPLRKGETMRERLVSALEIINIPILYFAHNRRFPENPPAGAIFVPAGSPIHKIAEYSERHRLLTITDAAGPVERGLCAIGVVIADERLSIHVNKRLLDKEGIEISPELIGLASTIWQ